MAQASKRTRQLRRTKRERSILLRQQGHLLMERQALRIEGARSYRILLAILAQTGGVTVTKGTFAQVEERIKQLSYQVTASEQGDEFTVCLVDHTPTETEPAA